MTTRIPVLLVLVFVAACQGCALPAGGKSQGMTFSDFPDFVNAWYGTDRPEGEATYAERLGLSDACADKPLGSRVVLVSAPIIDCGSSKLAAGCYHAALDKMRLMRAGDYAYGPEAFGEAMEFSITEQALINLAVHEAAHAALRCEYPEMDTQGHHEFMEGVGIQ